MFKNMTYRYYVSLKDIINADTFLSVTGFEDFFTAGEVTVVVDDAYTKALMKDYIFPKNWRNIAFYYDCSHKATEEEKEAKFQKRLGVWLGELYSWLSYTKERYKALIDIQEENLGNLMDDVKSESETRFNDTPQTTTIDLDSDEYNTTVTKSKTSTNVSTKISRIQEIKDNLRSVYEEWMYDFESNMLLQPYWIDEEYEQ